MRLTQWLASEGDTVTRPDSEGDTVTRPDSEGDTVTQYRYSVTLRVTDATCMVCPFTNSQPSVMKSFWNDLIGCFRLF